MNKPSSLTESLKEHIPNVAIIGAAVGLFSFAIWKIAHSEYEASKQPKPDAMRHVVPDRWDVRAPLIVNEEMHKATEDFDTNGAIIPGYDDGSYRK